MTIDIKPIHHDDYLEIIVTGSFDLKDALDWFHGVIDICHPSGTEKILIDYRQLQTQGGESDKILYTIGIQGIYKEFLKSGGHDLQIAYVHLMNRDYEPGVETIERRELPFKLFDKINDALEWLDVKTT